MYTQGFIPLVEMQLGSLVRSYRVGASRLFYSEVRMVPLDEKTICVLCGRPLGPSSGALWLMHLQRDAWAHRTCFQQRYHPEPKVHQEPEEKQAAMELSPVDTEDCG